MCDTYDNERILEYLLDRMAGDERERFERHADGCADCAAALEELRPIADLSGVVCREPGPGVESRVMEDVAPRRRMAAWTMMSAAACLMLTAGVLVYRYDQALRFAGRVVARVETAGAGVTIVRGGRPMSCSAGMPLAVGDRVETGEGVTVAFAYTGETTRVRIGHASLVWIDRVGKGKKLVMDRGSLDATVAPQPEGAPMLVFTPHARATVLGTVFSLSAAGNGTMLSVEEGTVRMSLPEGDSREDVGGGKVAIARPGADRVLVPGKLVRTMRVTGLAGRVKICGVAAGAGKVWVHGVRGEEGESVVAVLDPATGRILKEVPIGKPFRSGSCIAWEDGLLWGFSRDGTRLVGIDTETGVVSRDLTVPAGTTSSLRIFDLDGKVGWFRGRDRKEIVRIDLDRGAVTARVMCPFGIDRIAASGGAVYAAEQGWNACRIDPERASVTYRFMCEAAAFTGDMALDDDELLWIVAGTEPVVHVLEAE